MERSPTASSDLFAQVSDWASSNPDLSMQPPAVSSPHTQLNSSINNNSNNGNNSTKIPDNHDINSNNDNNATSQLPYLRPSSPLPHRSKPSHNLPANFSELDFMDSGLGRSLTSNLPVLALRDELDSLQYDDLFAEEYLLSKLQDAQRRLQEVRDDKASIGDNTTDPHGTSNRPGLHRRFSSSPTSPSVAQTKRPISSTLQLFVASFRLPLTVELGNDGNVKSTAASAALGLVSAFKDISAQFPIRWVGAPGQTVQDLAKLPPEERAEMDRHLKTARHRKPPGMLSYAPVFPDPEDAAQHQEFCSSVLWPLFHYISFNLGERSYHVEMFRAYVRVNRFYARALIDEWKRSGVDETDAMFWVHDFQLCLVPKMIRDLLPNARIGFFLHIPFPTREVFRILAPRKEILEGMLGADLLGFHTYDYARHFLSTCQRVLDLRTRPDSIDNKGIDVHIAICPFGIDAETFIAATKQTSVMELTTRLKESLAGKKIVLGVDRLDYIKGIPHKLLAIEHFLEHHPEWVGKVIFLQVTTPSTSGSDEYHAFREEILEMVGQINGRFATIEDIPIHYRELNMTLEELCALYAGADVAMITSIRDGMNLVSYEYIACQKESHGVLILSEFAGAAKNLPGAVLVNPWDVEEVSGAIVRSLEMAQLERELRHKNLYRHVLKHSSAAWGVSFIDDLIKYSAQRSEQRKDLVEMPVNSICESYRSAQGKRVFFLDYDGTLRKYESQPELAYPSAALLRTIQKLATNERNVVFIVTGRQKATMTTWFRGTGVGYAVEHGFSLRWPDHLREVFGGRRFMDGSQSGGTGTENGIEERLGDEDDIDGAGGVGLGDEERMIREDQHTWDDLLKPDELIAMRQALQTAGDVLRHVEECTPSSFVSQKESAFSWHFRDADPTFAQIRAQETKQTLEERLAGSPMEVLMGDMILYVRPRGVHKAAAVNEVLKRLGADVDDPISWIYSVGNDCTDEEMFTELYRFAKDTDITVSTCTVGRKTTRAKYFVSGVDDILQLLSSLGECG